MTQAGVFLFDFVGYAVAAPAAAAPAPAHGPCVVDWGKGYLELADDGEFGGGYAQPAGDAEFAGGYAALAADSEFPTAYLELADDSEFAGGYAQTAGDETFGTAYLELECETLNVTLTVPADYRGNPAQSYTVPYVLARQTRQEDVISTDDRTLDGFFCTFHLWSDNLQGVTPKEGMFINDGADDYEIKSVSHDNRRQRFKCVGLRVR